MAKKAPAAASKTPTDDAPTRSRAADDAILEELRERFTYATKEWREIRDDGKKDMRYVGGDPWDEKDRKAREDAGRPCLSLDELGQYVNQLINDVRQNKRGIKVTPMGNGANDQTAEFRQDLMRQIEYRSNAQTGAYTTMFENTVQRSYGYLRIVPEFSSPRSLNQELLIKGIPNPDLVTPDPDFLDPTGADWRYLFYHQRYSVKEFRKKWPKARVQSFTTEDAILAPDWIQGESVLVGEYWTVDSKPDRLTVYRGPDGREFPVLDSDTTPVPKGLQLLGSRQVDRPYVCQYLTNGVELLETDDPLHPGEQRIKAEWPGKSIPFVLCPGKILYVDDGAGAHRKILSMIRLARDPYMLYCYYRTTQAEHVGMSTRFPYFVRRGSLTENEGNRLTQSTHEPVGFIYVETQAEGMAGPPEMPQRNPFEPQIQSLELGAEGARRAIQAAMGISPLPTAAQQRNEKSGIALQRIEQTSQKGSYHFIDHYEAALTRTGAILDELIPHYYDAARDVTVRGQDDEAKVMRINDPQAQQPIIVADGDHDVTLSVGPAFESQREAAETFADTLAGNPAVFPIIADLVVKLKQLGPIGDEIADRLTPQQFRKQKQGQPPSQADVAGMQMQLQQMQQMLMQAKQALDTEQAKQQATVEQAKIKAAADVQIAQLKGQIDVQIASIKAQQDAATQQHKAAAEIVKSDAAAQEAERQRQYDAYQSQQEQLHAGALAVGSQQHAAAEAERGRLHEAGQAERQRSYDAIEAERARAVQPPPSV